LYAQNWLKIKTSYLFLNFDLAKGGLQQSEAFAEAPLSQVKVEKCFVAWCSKMFRSRFAVQSIAN